MVLKILLIIAILLQLIAVLVALRLVKRTKFNIAWILFTTAFLAMCVLRVGEWFQFADKTLRVPPDFFIWIGVITSFCFAVGVFYIQKILNYIDNLNFRRQLTDRRILSAVLRTEEKERMRFSKELHDGLGPLLSSAKMSLSALAKLNNSGENKEIVDNTVYVIDEAIRSLREVSNNLSPHVLKDFGLARAVNNFINRSVLTDDIKISFTTNLRAERFDRDTEVILYRVACELVNNSIKHAECSAINLDLQYNAGVFRLDYSDNGKGFNPQREMDSGMGLSNITSRIKSLKGTIDIKSSKGKGMSAHIEINTLQGNGSERRK